MKDTVTGVSRKAMPAAPRLSEKHLTDNKLGDEDRRNLVCSVPLLHLLSKESEEECRNKKGPIFNIEIMLDNTAL